MVQKYAGFMKVVTLEPGNNLPLNKQGMYILVEGKAFVTRDDMSPDQQKYLDYISQHQSYFDYNFNEVKSPKSELLSPNSKRPNDVKIPKEILSPSYKSTGLNHKLSKNVGVIL